MQTTGLPNDKLSFIIIGANLMINIIFSHPLGINFLSATAIKNGILKDKQN